MNAPHRWILRVEGYVDFSTDSIAGFTNLKEGKGAKSDRWTYYLETKGILKDGKRYELTIREI